MVFRLHVDDTAPNLERQLVVNGVAQNITGFKEVSFKLWDEYFELVVDDDTNGNVNIVDASSGIVEYDWQPSDTTQAGEYFGQFTVVYGDDEIVTFPNSGRIRVKIE